MAVNDRNPSEDPGLDTVGGIAAPLLAGIAFALIALVLQIPTRAARWRDAALCLLIGSGIALIMAVQAVMWAKQYSETKLGNYCAAGARYAYDAGIASLLAATAALLVPRTPLDQLDTGRAVAIGLALGGLALELGWIGLAVFLNLRGWWRLRAVGQQIEADAVAADATRPTQSSDGVQTTEDTTGAPMNIVPKKPTTPAAVRTYRYLRIGMIGAVLLLGTSILLEHGKANCWQTSISAYYYTPVRAIFVSTMVAVGLALIVLKGHGPWEDSCLNFAGMLAPVVAVAPTNDVGKCWSVTPRPLPVHHHVVAHWVDVNINNNFNALLIAGAIGLVGAFLITIAVNRSLTAPFTEVDVGTSVSLAVTAVALVVGWWLLHHWSDFDRRAHGFAAVGMFLFLIGAVVSKAIEHRNAKNRGYFGTYTAVGLLMGVGGIIIAAARVGGSHTVFVLEAFEITLFAVFWLVQTQENWNERPAN